MFYRKQRSAAPSLISTLLAHRLLYKGCIGFLAYVFDTSTSEVSLEDVPIVQDFPNVFSNELLKLPLEWELEFAINLAPETYHISLPPYRMALTKLKELKT